MSPNQRKDPPTLSISEFKSLPEPVSPTQLQNHVWALQSYPFLPFILNSPFHGAMTSHFATPPDIEVSRQGYHISTEVSKSWKSLEQSCRQAATVLCSTFEQDYPKVSLSCITPAKPSEFGYFTAHSSKEKACSAISQTLLPSRSVILNHYLNPFLQFNFTIVYGLDVSFIISHHSKVRWHAGAALSSSTSSPFAPQHKISPPQRLELQNPLCLGPRTLQY